MRATPTLTLLTLAIVLASSPFVDGDSAESAVASLPPVDAPPPELANATAEPAAAAPAAPDTSWTDRAVGLEDDPGQLVTADDIHAYLSSRHTGLSRAEVRDLAEVIVQEAERHAIHPGLVLAVIQVESGGYHRAVSPVGALGLMQILPSTGEELARQQGIPWLGDEMLFDPQTNVRLGVAYLKQLSDRYSHVSTALAAYNWGPGRIDRRLRNGHSVPEIYVNQIRRAYDSVGGELARRTSSS